jgi:hypothetical protein
MPATLRPAGSEDSVRQKPTPLEEAMQLAGLVSDFGLSIGPIDVGDPSPQQA